MRLIALLLGALLLGWMFWLYLQSSPYFAPPTSPSSQSTIDQSLRQLETSVTGYQQQLNQLPR